MDKKTCCVTGHRDIPAERIAYVEQELRREVRAAIEDGYTRFISGFAEGTDLMFAAIVAEEMEHHPELFLEAAIPYAGRIKTKNQQFHELLRACNGVKIVCEEYEHSCFMQRNRYMAGESQRVIAVYDGRRDAFHHALCSYAGEGSPDDTGINFGTFCPKVLHASKLVVE